MAPTASPPGPLRETLSGPLIGIRDARDRWVRARTARGTRGRTGCGKRVGGVRLWVGVSMWTRPSTGSAPWTTTALPSFQSEWEPTNGNWSPAPRRSPGPGRGAHGGNRPAGRFGDDAGGGAAETRRAGVLPARDGAKQGPRRLPRRDEERQAGREGDRRPVEDEVEVFEGGMQKPRSGLA